MGYCPFEHKARRWGTGRWGTGRAGYGRARRRLAVREAQACGAQGRAALRHGSLVLLYCRLGGHDTATTHGMGVPVRRLGVLAGSAGLCVCTLCT